MLIFTKANKAQAMEHSEKGQHGSVLPPPVTKRTSCIPQRSPIHFILLRLLALLGAVGLLERLLFPVWPTTFLRPAANSTLLSMGRETLEINETNSATASASLPATKAIIASSMKHDNVTWIHENLPDWEANIYVMDDEKANITVAKQKGREAAAYLSYLITHYHNLPDYMVFIHAERYQWHNDDMMFDHLPNLENIKLAYIDQVGYTSLRCVWNPGCPYGLKPDIDHEDGYFEWEGEFAKAWAYLFPEEDLPGEVGHPCCAQFAVTREQVRKRSVQFYERVRQWLWDSDINSQKTGRILEYSWHKIFGQDSTSCPDAGNCYCKLYGYCGLKCPDQGSCRGRVWPLRYDQQSLPEGWPHRGQGENGMPEAGWWLPKWQRPLRAKMIDGEWHYGRRYDYDFDE